MIASYLPDSLLYMRGFKEQGVQPKAIMAQDAGFIDPGFVRTLGADAEGVFTREVFSSAVDQVIVVRAAWRPRDQTASGGSWRRSTSLQVLAA